MDAAARALGEPTRRAILRLVRDEEQTVSAIASNFGVSRPAISQHLRVLQDAELVTVRSEGTRRYYRARPEGLGELRAWLDEFWSSSLHNLKIEVERQQWNDRKASAGADKADRKNKGKKETKKGKSS